VINEDDMVLLYICVEAPFVSIVGGQITSLSKVGLLVHDVLSLGPDTAPPRAKKKDDKLIRGVLLSGQHSDGFGAIAITRASF